MPRVIRAQPARNCSPPAMASPLSYAAPASHLIGLDLDAPLDLKEKTYQLWERQVHAVMLALVRQKLLVVDEMRRAIEALTPEQQKHMTYYEKWAGAIAAICLERGTLSQSDLYAQADPDVTVAGYREGDVVRVKEEARGPQWRRPHLRTPGYLHGLVGVISMNAQGTFGDPEALAFRQPAPKQPLYRVRFLQADVWEGYAGPDTDEVQVDIYEPWLEPSDRKALEEQKQARETRRAIYRYGAHSGGDHHHGHHHDHAHDHAHGHGEGPHVHEARCQVEAAAVAKEGPEETERARFPETLVRVLVAKGIVSAEEIRAGIEKLDAIGTRMDGARLVARAWVDPEYKARLLKDGNAAAEELGVSGSVYPTAGKGGGGSTAAPPPGALPSLSGTLLTVVENTPGVHNLVVCTLCSCYPLAVLGMSPPWYKSRAYRARAVRNPRGVLKEFGTDLPDSVRVVVHDATADNRFLVLPARPEGTEGWSEAELQAIVTRDCMIGVALPKAVRSVPSGDA